MRETLDKSRADRRSDAAREEADDDSTDVNGAKDPDQEDIVCIGEEKKKKERKKEKERKIKELFLIYIFFFFFV